MADSKGGHSNGEEGVNVQVLLRCRPLSDKEVAERAPQVVTCNEALREVTLFQSTAGKSSSRTFRFDKVFGCDTGQEKLFKQAIMPIVHEVMDGFNCTIFAYGQTGTGKTYTMEGGPRESDDGRRLSAQAGVIPRSIKQIFDHIEASNIDSTVKVSFLELYNEELTDLLSLDDPSSSESSKKLRLLEDRSGVVVQGLEEVIVRTATEIYQVLDRGTAKRRTAATLLNQRSSRSHSIFTITIHMKETTPEGEDVIKIGKLNLVDLAGSENISRSGAKDNRAREAGSINQSLLTLGRVITALVDHSGHVPYRDSKLTRLLRDSLGGRTKTCIIATIAPTVQCQEETISTLDYAHRAKNIRNRPELNQKISKTTMIKELAAEIEKLKLDLLCTREKNGVYLSNERYEQGELERAQLRESVKALRAELEASEGAHEQAVGQLEARHAAEVGRLKQELERRAQQLTATRDELDATTISLQERVFLAATLRRAEQSLVGFAERLVGDLGLCAQDVQQLSGHLHQVSSLQGADRACLRQAQQLVQSRVRELGVTLAAAVSAQQHHLTAIGQDVASFAAHARQAAQALGSRLDDVQRGVDQLSGLAGQGLGAAGERAAAAAAQAGEQARALGRGAGEVAGEVGAAAAAAVEALVAALGAQCEALEGMAARRREEAGELERRLAELTAAADAALQGSAAAAAEAKSAEESHQRRVDDLVQGFASSFDRALQQQQAELLQKMGEMVQAFASERSQAVAAGLQGIRHALQEHGAGSARRADGLAAAAGTAAAQVQELGKALSGQLSGAQASFESAAGAARAGAQQAAAGGAASKQQLAARCDEGLRAISATTQRLCEALDAEQGAARGQAAAAQEQVAAGAKQAAAAREAAALAVQEHQQEAAVFAGAMARQAEDAGTTLQGSVEELQRDVQQMGAEVAQAVAQALGVEPPARPALRSAPSAADGALVGGVAVPPASAVHELVCPSDEVVFTQLRNTKREIMRRGGDVRQAGALLLSPLSTLVAASPGTVRNMIRAPPSPVAFDAGARAAAPGSPTAVAVVAAAATAGAPQQPPRSSKIPGAPPGGSAALMGSKEGSLAAAAGRPVAALGDRTNVVEGSGPMQM